MDVRLPDRDHAVVADILDRRSNEHPDREFIIFESGPTWTYGQAAEEVWAVAAGFQSLGIAHGDYVLSWLPTGPHALLTWFASNALGAAYTPLNPAYRGSILQHVINVPRSKVMIVHADLVDRLEGLDLPHLETIVIVGETDAAPDTLRSVRWDDLKQVGASRPAVEEPVEPWDDMAVIYTSGTTGPSKAVRCSYMHHYTFGRGLFPETIGEDDRFFLCLPMFHASATTPVYCMLQRGGSLVVTPGFSTDTFWADVRKYRTTTAIIMAAMATFLHKQPPQPDDADNPLRIAYMGPMIDDVEGFSKRFDVELYSTYAMTEVPNPIRTPMNPTNAKSCGRLLGEGWEVRLVDEHDLEVPVGTPGELIVRHSTPWCLNSGYLGMPEATAEAWRNGWFHSGDALMVDDNGDYHFVDRVKDALRRRGENISSVELESEILTHPDVREAAVVGVPSDVKEDDVLAFVVRAPGSELDYETLTEYLIPRLPYFMVPRYFEFVDELPKTPSMKVRKVELRAIGLSENTWDREASGIILKRERLTPVN